MAENWGARKSGRTERMIGEAVHAALGGAHVAVVGADYRALNHLYARVRGKIAALDRFRDIRLEMSNGVTFRNGGRISLHVAGEMDWATCRIRGFDGTFIDNEALSREYANAERRLRDEVRRLVVARDPRAATATLLHIERADCGRVSVDAGGSDACPAYVEETPQLRADLDLRDRISSMLERQAAIISELAGTDAFVEMANPKSNTGGWWSLPIDGGLGSIAVDGATMDRLRSGTCVLLPDVGLLKPLNGGSAAGAAERLVAEAAVAELKTLTNVRLEGLTEFQIQSASLAGHGIVVVFVREICGLSSVCMKDFSRHVALWQTIRFRDALLARQREMGGVFAISASASRDVAQKLLAHAESAHHDVVAGAYVDESAQIGSDFHASVGTSSSAAEAGATVSVSLPEGKDPCWSQTGLPPSAWEAFRQKEALRDAAARAAGVRIPCEHWRANTYTVGEHVKPSPMYRSLQNAKDAVPCGCGREVEYIRERVIDGVGVVALEVDCDSVAEHDHRTRLDAWRVSHSGPHSDAKPFPCYFREGQALIAAANIAIAGYTAFIERQSRGHSASAYGWKTVSTQSLGREAGHATTPLCGGVSGNQQNLPSVSGRTPVDARQVCAYAAPVEVGERIAVAWDGLQAVPSNSPDYGALQEARLGVQADAEREVLSSALRRLREIPVCPHGGKVSLVAMGNDRGGAVYKCAYLVCDRCSIAR